MGEIRIHKRSSAPVETVWAVLYDQLGMAAWVPLSSVRLEREGEPPPNGVGAIRVLSGLGLRVREEITAVEPPTRLTYRLLSGAPVRDYIGETALTAVDGATDIVWTAALRSRVPGVTLVVRLIISAMAKGLVAESERRERETDSSSATGTTLEA